MRVVELGTGYSRTTSREVLAQAGISEGTRILESQLVESIELFEPDTAKARAIRALSYREHSAAQIHQKLLQDGYPPDIASHVRDRLVELGLVDDARFAEMFISSKSASGWGRPRILRSLADAGIPPALAELPLDNMVPETGEVERALSHIGETGLSDRRVRERMLRRLVRRGFSYSVALEALSHLASDPYSSNRNESES